MQRKASKKKDSDKFIAQRVFFDLDRVELRIGTKPVRGFFVTAHDSDDHSSRRWLRRPGGSDTDTYELKFDVASDRTCSIELEAQWKQGDDSAKDSLATGKLTITIKPTT